MSTRRNNTQKKVGVVLMTYGSATKAENVELYFQHIYPNNTNHALIKDFQERYRLVGGSPLVETTLTQAKLLEESLGESFVVRAGMRHSEPFISKAITDCKEAGADKLVGIILAPQFSAHIMDGYREDFTIIAQVTGFSKKNTVLVGPWPDEAHFVQLLATRLLEAVKLLEAKHEACIPVVFTTHSLPKKVLEHDKNYLTQLQTTTNAILQLIKKPIQHYSAFQSAGHTPEEWLKPDLTDILRELKKEGASAVLIVPIQFLSDHLEVLYDLDIAARAQCEELDIEYNRIALPNTDARFIACLHSLVTKHTPHNA